MNFDDPNSLYEDPELQMLIADILATINLDPLLDAKMETMSTYPYDLDKNIAPKPCNLFFTRPAQGEPFELTAIRPIFPQHTPYGPLDDNTID